MTHIRQKLISGGVFLLLAALALSSFDAAKAVSIVPSSTTDLVKISNSPTVYAIAPNGTQRAMTSAANFTSYGYSFTQVSTVPQSLLARFPATRVIMVSNNPTVYRLNNDFTKQPFATYAAFTNAGFQPGDIVTVNQTELNSYPTGAILDESNMNPTSLPAFEQAINSAATTSTSSIQSFLTDPVSIAQLGSGFSSQSSANAAQTIVDQVQGMGNYNFNQGQPEISSLKSSYPVLQDMVVGLTGRTGANNSEKRLLAYRVNNSNKVDQVIYYSNICSIGGITCQ